MAEYAVEQGRSTNFRVQVVCGYQHACALTGYRIITQSAASVVDAAHIEHWAKNPHNDIHNGLALSRNAHWAFDRGLWSVDDSPRRRASDRIPNICAGTAKLGDSTKKLISRTTLRFSRYGVIV